MAIYHNGNEIVEVFSDTECHGTYLSIEWIPTHLVVTNPIYQTDCWYITTLKEAELTTRYDRPGSSEVDSHFRDTYIHC